MGHKLLQLLNQYSIIVIQVPVYIVVFANMDMIYAGNITFILFFMRTNELL